MAPPNDQDFLDFVLDQLAGLKAVTSKRMFGAIGLYQADTFFAIIDEGRLYFVTNEATREAYTSLGMKPFQYAPGKLIHTYYEVPVDILEDDGALCEWARAAVAAQGDRARKAPARSRTKSHVRTSASRTTKPRTAKARTPRRKRP
jgi:DNA transformation protein